MLIKPDTSYRARVSRAPALPVAIMPSGDLKITAAVRVTDPRIFSITLAVIPAGALLELPRMPVLLRALVAMYGWRVLTPLAVYQARALSVSAVDITPDWYAHRALAGYGVPPFIRWLTCRLAARWQQRSRDSKPWQGSLR